MLMYKITKKQALDFSKEEHDTSVKYRKMGFKKEAADEARHSKTFANVAKQL